MGVSRLNPDNRKPTGFLRRTNFSALTGQSSKTNFQVLQSITGKGYLDRAFMNMYWVFYSGHWLRFRIVADGAVIYDHLVDATYQASYGQASFGVAHMKYAETEFSPAGTFQEYFIHPSYNSDGVINSKVSLRNIQTLEVGLPPAITGVVGGNSYGITPLIEPIYFNTSLSIEASMSSGSSIGAGALVISGGLI
jgi:hypothetical protein